MARERAARKTAEDNVVELPKARTRAKAETKAPVKAESKARKSLTVPKGRKAPAGSTSEAVALLVNAALNANSDLSSLSAGKVNLLILGAGLAATSAEASVLVEKALKAGNVVEAA